MQENNNEESRRNSVMDIPIENKELGAYLHGNDLRKDKFRLFAKKFNLDQILNLQQFYKANNNSNNSNYANNEGDLEMDTDIEAFIRFLAKKLETEQKNRLKTEE